MVLAFGPDALSTADGRSRVARTLVCLATELETSPTLWSRDFETGATRLSGHSRAEVEAALTKVRPDDRTLFQLSGGSRP